MSRDLASIAISAGLVQRHRGLGPCPVCGAETRGHHDRRPPISLFIRDGEERWHCKVSGCGAGGGAVALLAAVRFREIPPKGDPRWAEIFGELEDQRFSPVIRRPSSPVRVTRPLVPADSWPPVVEVGALWQGCQRVANLAPDDPVRGYLRTRGIDAARISILDLSRTLSTNDTLPRWVPNMGVDTRVWSATYRLVTPMFDPTGAVRSLRFRAIGEAPGGKKALNPRGHGYAGLVMADPMARALLRGERADEGVAWDGRVVIVEGEPDFWTWACHPARFGKPSTWAVLGVVSGSWTEQLAARMPDDARVVIRTHHDEPGQKYAERIRSTLAERCEVLRSTPPRTPHAETA